MRKISTIMGEYSEMELVLASEKIIDTVREKYGNDPAFKDWEDDFETYGSAYDYMDDLDNPDALYRDFEMYKENI